jgi:uncharacterized membrane protein
MRTSKRVVHGVQALCGVTVIGLGLLASRPVSAQQVSSQTLIYATYEGEETAGNVFKEIKANQKSTGEHIESYAVVSKDVKGKVHVRDQRSRDAKVGAVLGAVIGAVGGPVGAAAGAAAGGSLGYLTGNEVGITKDTVENMKTSLTPGSSALTVVLDDRWVQDVEKGLKQANARHVVAEKIATGASNPPPATSPSKD